MASIQIKNRTARNLNPKFIDFSATPSQGNAEVNFFICSAFCPATPAFCHPVIEKKYIPD